MPDGNAIVYCEGAFGTPNGKTAHGLIRFTERYKILSVIDSKCAGKRAGEILGDTTPDIPIVKDLQEALVLQANKDDVATHFVIGLAPDGGKLNPAAMSTVKEAIKNGLDIDSGMHDFLSEMPEIQELASENNIIIRDVRKPPHRNDLHFFSGKIEDVKSLKIAVLGTDSAVGKRTTARVLINHFNNEGNLTAEMIGTGQTAWMQGCKYCLILDSLINDFVAGEIEHQTWSAWNDKKPDVIILEGQGSLLNPAFPGGFEVLAAARPDAVIMQHAPARIDYDGFPGYKIHPLEKQIQAVELLSEKPVAAITVNHENIQPDKIKETCEKIEKSTGLPTIDVLTEGPERLAGIIMKMAVQKKEQVL
jgi:uncharacterized NAD-dependent epimerase/dehydratase family protein